MLIKGIHQSYILNRRNRAILYAAAQQAEREAINLQRQKAQLNSSEMCRHIFLTVLNGQRFNLDPLFI